MKATTRKPSISERAEIARKSSVLEFLELTIENAYTFHGVNTIPLTKTGMVNVIGENLDTKLPSSNGAGKSRMWFCLLRLLYGRKALDKEKPSDAYNPEVGNFFIGVKFRKNGHEYFAYEAKKHSKYKDGFHVVRDGKPWGVKNDPEMLRRELQGVINRTYEEFIGTVIWKQNNDHALIDGTPNERSKWISDFFGLSVYDDLFAVFSKKLEITKSEISDMADVRAKTKILKDKLAGVSDIDQTRKDVAKLKLRIASDRDVIARAEKAMEALRTREAKVKVLRELKATIEEDGLSGIKTSELASRISQSKSAIAELQEKLRLASSATKTKNAYIRVKSRREDARKTILAICKDVFNQHAGYPELQSVKQIIREGSGKLAVLRQSLSKADAMLEKAAELSDALKKLKDQALSDCSIEYMEGMINTHRESNAEIKSDIAKLEVVLDTEKMVKDHVTKCPTCGTRLDIKDMAARLSKAKQEISEKRSGIAKNDKMIRYFTEGIALRRIVDKFGDKIEDLDRDLLLKKIRKLEVKLKAAEKLEELISEVTELTKEMLQLRPDYLKLKDMSKIDVEACEKDIRKLESGMDKLVRAKSLLSQYEELSASMELSKPIDAELSDIRRRLESHSDESDEVSEKITKRRIKIDRLRSAISEYEAVNSELAVLEESNKKLKRLERDERVYKSLKKAYDKNGLKVRRLRELLNAIKTRLPVWTRILFTEKNFKIDIPDNEKQIGFKITQTKIVNGAKKTKTYDARAASGSERTRISCALMLTMADVASSEKQCNLMVLDELERGLDAQSRQNMSEDVITLLKHKKPSLFLITHSLNIDPTNFDAELRITKKHQMSSTSFKKTRWARPSAEAESTLQAKNRIKKNAKQARKDNQ